MKRIFLTAIWFSVLSAMVAGPSEGSQLDTEAAIRIVVVYADDGVARKAEPLQLPAGTTLRELVLHERLYKPNGCIQWTQGQIRLERLQSVGKSPLSLVFYFRDIRDPRLKDRTDVKLERGDILISDGWGDF